VDVEEEEEDSERGRRLPEHISLVFPEGRGAEEKREKPAYS
jgi:hypothetical protein